MLARVSSLSGFHAGDPNSMDRVVKLAQQQGRGLGGHPGYRDLPGFGLRDIQTSSEELVNDIVYKVGAIRERLIDNGTSPSRLWPLCLNKHAKPTLSQEYIHG